MAANPCRPMLLRATQGVLNIAIPSQRPNWNEASTLQKSCEALRICTVSEAGCCLQGLDIVQEHENFKLQTGEGPRQPKGRSVDLSQLSLQDTNEEEVRS